MNGRDLKRLRAKKKVTQQQLSDETGVPLGTIARLEASEGEIKKISVYHAFDNYFKNEAGYLSEPTEDYKVTLVKNTSVPVYDVEFAAGVMTRLIESREDHYPVGFLSIPEVQGCEAIIRARGDSMADKINDGDWIGIKKIDGWQEWLPMNYIYAISTDNMELIKYLKKGTNDNNFTIVSHNKFYDDDIIPKHLIKEIWAVKAVLPFGKIETFI